MSHRQNDVLGIDISETVRSVVKQIEADRERGRRLGPKLWTPDGGLRGPFQVRVEQRGTDSFTAEVTDPPEGVSTIRSWGRSAERAVQRLRGNYGHALVDSELVADLEKAADIAVEAKFEVVDVRSLFE